MDENVARRTTLLELGLHVTDPPRALHNVRVASRHDGPPSASFSRTVNATFAPPPGDSGVVSAETFDSNPSAASVPRITPHGNAARASHSARAIAPPTSRAASW